MERARLTWWVGDHVNHGDINVNQTLGNGEFHIVVYRVVGGAGLDLRFPVCVDDFAEGKITAADNIDAPGREVCWWKND